MVSDFIIESTTCLTCNNAFLKELNTIQGVFGALGRVGIAGSSAIAKLPKTSHKHLPNSL
ncbi:MAG: hypothetical protein CR987_00535 [Draconibacterium sp.]|nr:MAG: hypothetical protein CR987_00535 [Draconibacterium sp.]